MSLTYILKLYFKNHLSTLKRPSAVIGQQGPSAHLGTMTLWSGFHCSVRFSISRTLSENVELL